jgi:hypothetical protein
MQRPREKKKTDQAVEIGTRGGAKAQKLTLDAAPARDLVKSIDELKVPAKTQPFHRNGAQEPKRQLFAERPRKVHTCVVATIRNPMPPTAGSGAGSVESPGG